MKVKHVKWIDTCTTHGWVERHEQAIPLFCETIGFVVYEDRKVLKLAHTIADGGLMAEITVIPKINIVKSMKGKNP